MTRKPAKPLRRNDAELSFRLSWDCPTDTMGRAGEREGVLLDESSVSEGVFVFEMSELLLCEGMSGTDCELESDNFADTVESHGSSCLRVISSNISFLWGVRVRNVKKKKWE